ncbi:MAG: hypothetical protein HYV26_00025 [Candidatus Hydrogenedentes bacterium]|nr:hypothetical protein [Candidatus Hydrogenedentota bacterium]
MECSVCKVRSTIGYCKECQRVLCEVCSIPCDRCKKLLCRVHRQRTPGGRNLCAECMAHRNARRAQQEQEKASKKEETFSFQDLLDEFGDEVLPGPKKTAVKQEAAKIEEFRPDWAGEAPPEPPPKQEPPKTTEDEINARILTGSAARSRPLWINSAIIGVMACLLGFTAGRNTYFGSLLQPWLSYVIMLVACAAILWAIMGWRQKEQPLRDRRLCGIGLVLGCIALVLAWVGY